VLQAVEQIDVEIVRYHKKQHLFSDAP